MRKFGKRALLALLVFICTIAYGCMSSRGPGNWGNTSAPPLPSHKLFSTSTPTQFSGIAGWMDALAVLSVVLIAVGVALFCFAPEAHRLSFGIAGGAGALLVTSLTLHASLWMIPLFSRGIAFLIAAAIVTFGVEIYLKVKALKPTSAAAAIGDVPKAVKEIFDHPV